MEFIAIADTHISLYSNDQIVKESKLPLRLHTLDKVLQNIVYYAIGRGIHIVAILGDVFHTKSLIHALAQSVFLDFVRNFQQIEFIIIDGNHDMSSRSGTGVSALKCLDSEPNVRMLHHPELIDNVWFVPWGPDMVNEIKSRKGDYLCAHIGVNEAQLSSGISVVSEIKMSDLTKYEHCILAHYHKPQSIGNITYVGSPIQLDWGEKHEEKRFLIVDSSKFTMESVPTTGYKKHFEFVITKDNKDEIVKKAREAKEDGDYVNIVKKEEVDTDDIVGEFRIVNKVEIDVTDRGVSLRMSQKDRLQRYIEIKGVKEEERDLYERVALDIIENVEV